MQSVDEAVAQLLKQSRELVTVEDTALSQTLGRVLAEHIVAGIDVPPADNSAMDGYALRHADWTSAEVPIEVSMRIPAGVSPSPLLAGTAARIFTGAEIPVGADTVVMQENCETNANQVFIHTLPDQSTNIRRRAQDVAIGQAVFSPGSRIRPQDIGLIASLGIASVRTFRPLKVAVISNGDELREPGEQLMPGQIYNSNRYLLCGLMKGWGFEVVDMGIAPDDPESIRELLCSAAQQADVIVSSGGVSVGEEDHIKNVVSELGGIDLWKVSIKPGKPFAFGNVDGVPFLGLPGNPSSVLVTCLIIARPFLMASQGISDTEVIPLRKPALFSRKQATRTEYLRVKSSAIGLECFPQQSSGVLLSTVWGDGLGVHREGEVISAGDEIDYLPYQFLL
ncbi:MAG: molybdopterin molybdotransferase [Lysobacterales bacterium]|jgi:molybdopterin molybdotransferase